MCRQQKKEIPKVDSFIRVLEYDSVHKVILLLFYRSYFNAAAPLTLQLRGRFPGASKTAQCMFIAMSCARSAHGSGNSFCQFSCERLTWRLCSCMSFFIRHSHIFSQSVYKKYRYLLNSPCSGVKHSSHPNISVYFRVVKNIRKRTNFLLVMLFTHVFIFFIFSNFFVPTIQNTKYLTKYYKRKRKEKNTGYYIGTIVPSLWEERGNLWWLPKKTDRKLTKYEQSKPNKKEWRLMACFLKRNNIQTYQLAEAELLINNGRNFRHRREWHRHSCTSDDCSSKSRRMIKFCWIFSLFAIKDF